MLRKNGLRLPHKQTLSLSKRQVAGATAQHARTAAKQRDALTSVLSMRIACVEKGSLIFSVHVWVCIPGGVVSAIAVFVGFSAITNFRFNRRPRFQSWSGVY